MDAPDKAKVLETYRELEALAKKHRELAAIDNDLGTSMPYAKVIKAMRELNLGIASEIDYALARLNHCAALEQKPYGDIMGSVPEEALELQFA